MIGFIKKDLLLIKENIRKLLIFLIIYGFMSLQGSIDISFMIPFLAVLLITSCFSYDEYNHFDAFAITFSNGKKYVVGGKYLTSILVVILSLILVSILSLVTGTIKNNLNILELFQQLLISFCSVSTLISIMFPFIFKFGMEKGRIMLFVIVFGLAFLGSALLRNINISFEFIETIFNNYWFIILILVPIILLYISYTISKKIYCKKEF